MGGSQISVFWGCVWSSKKTPENGCQMRSQEFSGQEMWGEGWNARRHPGVTTLSRSHGGFSPSSLQCYHVINIPALSCFTRLRDVSLPEPSTGMLLNMNHQRGGLERASVETWTGPLAYHLEEPSLGNLFLCSEPQFPPSVQRGR